MEHAVAWLSFCLWPCEAIPLTRSSPVKPLVRFLFPAFLLAAILTFVLQYEPFSGGHRTLESLILDVDWKPTEGGICRLYYDTGGGFLPARSVAANAKADTRQRSRFILPPGHLEGFRLVLPGHKGAAEIFGLRVTDLTENEILRLDPNQFWQDEDTDGVEFKDNSVVITNAATLTPEPPLDIQSADVVDKLQTAICFFAAFLLIAILLWKLDGARSRWYPRLRETLDRGIAGGRKRPRWTLFAIAALAVIVSCYPVIFFGKSFVSPNNRAPCLYDGFPTLPGAPAEPIEDPKGSDVGATLWQNLPYSVLQHRAIFRDHELPLWNRDNGCGVPLLGQGLSMLGDPLHWMTILADGAPWAWDAKFVLAKILFSFGVGMLVYLAVGRLGVASLLAASSAYLGFFSYRFNHPAFFSLCYSPWILAAWLGLSRTRDWRAAAPWIALLLSANFIELNSGTAKESSMLILGMNFTGVLVIALAREAVSVRIRGLAAGGLGLGLFLLIAAPFWMVFLDALKTAQTAYDVPQAYQIEPSLFIGLFDDLFYRQTEPFENLANPSANFLVLLGFLCALASGRRLAGNRAFLALALGALPALALAFGVIPPQWIVPLPFLGNVSHIDNTFSCVLIVLLFPLAGFGLQSSRDRIRKAGWRADWMAALLAGGVLMAAYLGYTQVVTRTGFALLREAGEMSKSRFFIGYAMALCAALALLPWSARGMLLGRAGFLSNAVVAGLCLFAMHFRHGMFLTTKFDPYVMNPQARIDLFARSPAVDYVKGHLAEPGRVSGFEGVLTPGFNAVLGLENINGPDALQNRYLHQFAGAAHFRSLWGWRTLVTKSETEALEPFYDLLGVRYYLGTPGEAPEAVPGLKRVASGDLDIYESPTVWPRAFFTDSLEHYDTVEQFAGMVHRADRRPFAATQAGENVAMTAIRGADGAMFSGAEPAKRRIAPAGEYALTSNSLSFQVDAPGQGLVVVGEAFEAGNFRVTLNGAPAQSFRVNQMFQGILIPAAGHYAVRMIYRPRMLTMALWISMSGLAALIGLALLWRRSSWVFSNTIQMSSGL